MTEEFWRNVRTTIEVGVLIVPPIMIVSLLLAAAAIWLSR